MEENNYAIELERLRLYGMNSLARHVNHQPYNGYSLDELKLLEGLSSNNYISCFPLLLLDYYILHRCDSCCLNFSFVHYNSLCRAARIRICGTFQL